MDPTHVTKFLSGCNIPPIDESTLRKKENHLAPAIIDAGKTSCETAREQEQINHLHKISRGASMLDGKNGDPDGNITVIVVSFNNNLSEQSVVYYIQ